MSRWFESVVIGCCAVLATLAHAEEGKVVIVEPGCPHFVLQMSEGFIIYEFLMGPRIKVGDVIEGDLTHAGVTKMTNVTQGGASTMFYLESGPMVEKRIEERTPYKCKIRRPKPKPPAAAPTQSAPAAPAEVKPETASDAKPEEAK